MGLEILHITTYIITNKLCKKNYPLKCIPGLALVRVLPLGQGGRPPDVQVGLKILHIITDIISSKFCLKIFALKCIPGLALVGVLPLGQVGRPQISGWVRKFSRLLLISFPASFVYVVPY